MSETSGKGGEHIRVPCYSDSARVNHWIVAITFVLLLVSGLALYIAALYPLTAPLGGGAVVRLAAPHPGPAPGHDLVDDVASIGLDMLLAEEGWKRGGHNPFLPG